MPFLVSSYLFFYNVLNQALPRLILTENVIFREAFSVLPHWVNYYHSSLCAKNFTWLKGRLMFHFTRILRTISHSVKRAMSSAVKPTVIFVLGGPGAGKGTQCEKIVKVSPDTKFTSKPSCRRGVMSCRSQCVHESSGELWTKQCLFIFYAEDFFAEWKNIEV